MSRKPSAETELKRTKHMLKCANREVSNLMVCVADLRQKAILAERERDEWKRRFDLLLARGES